MTVEDRMTMKLHERDIWKAVYSAVYAKHENVEAAFIVADNAVIELRKMFGLYGSW